MKRVSSVVWQFFDRLEENNRCVSVLCKLCDSEYKYFGNTTNLRAHLIKKHPLQWEFRQNNLDPQKPLEEQPTVLQYEVEENTDQSTVSSKRRKIVDVLDNTEIVQEQVDDDETETLNLVRQMHDNQGSDEEWLEEDYATVEMYEPPKKKPRKKIKREVVTPPRRSSTFTRQATNSQKPERIIIDNSNKDEYSVFGEYIANKLRKFTSPRTRGNIQQIITTVFWQAEYGYYDDANAVKRVLLGAVQDSPEVQAESAPDSGLQVTIEQFDTDKTLETLEECNENPAY